MRIRAISRLITFCVILFLATDLLSQPESTRPGPSALRLSVPVQIALLQSATSTGTVVHLTNFTTECEYLRDRGNRNRQSAAWQRAIDTLRLFIERCANEPGSAAEVSSLTGAVQSLAGQLHDLSIYTTHRDWLKSVMYLNSSDPLYYCAVANGILGTFAAGDDINGAIAVLDYLIESNKCSEGTPFYIKDRDKLRDDQVQVWQDTVKNPEATPLDTSKKTLEDLDLEILRGQNTVAKGEATDGAILKMLVSENPFKSENELTIELTKPVLARLSLHDAMGNIVWGPKELQRFSEGETSYPMPLALLASGTYYLRLATSLGEVRTIKLTKLK